MPENPPPDTEIFVVSLADAAERRDAFRERAGVTTLAWSFFDALRSPTEGLDIDEAALLRNKGRALTQGEIGCYASHFAIWRQMIARGVRQAIVLEDDTMVDWVYLAALASTDLDALEMPYLRLYAKRPCHQRVVRSDFLQHSRSVVELIGHAYGTQGYAITLAGARRFADHCAVIRRPIDDEMDRSWAHGVRNLALFPPPILEASMPSTIGAERFAAKGDAPRRTVGRRIERSRIRLLKLRRFLGV